MKDAIKEYIYWTSLAGFWIFAYITAVMLTIHIVALIF